MSVRKHEIVAHSKEVEIATVQSVQEIRCEEYADN